MFDKGETLIEYEVVNIISGESGSFTGTTGPNSFPDYLYGDDTNNMIINKIINYCYPKTVLTTNEIYAYSNNEAICFEYEKISEMNHIIKDNELVSKLLPDKHFVNKEGNQSVVKSINKYDKLFESNNLSGKTIYYFSLYELFNKLKIDLNSKPNMVLLNEKTGDFKLFFNGVIKKFFPKVTENMIKNYTDNPKKKEKENLRIRNLVKNNKDIFKSLNDKIYDDSNFLDPDNNQLNFKLMKLSTSFNIDNEVNIDRLFSDFPLSETYFLTKLLLEDYEDTYFKLYKKSLKLELSSDDKLINKRLCKLMLKDYREYIPLNVGFMPSFIKYENIFFIKVHTVIETGDIFYSFILHLDGNVDIIINNYNNILIGDEDLQQIVNDSNEIIKKINNNRIYSYEPLHELVLHENIKLEYYNCDMVYSLDNFTDDKGRYIYKKTNIMKFINNYYTHFRLLKERMDLSEDDSIHIHYKRVADYENMDVFDSVISALKHPRFAYSNDNIIEIIHGNYGISIERAREVFQHWEEINTLKEEDGYKTYRLASKEPGSEIIIDKHGENTIKIRLFNVTSFNELNRIKRFIKFMMKQYQLFVSKKIEPIYEGLFLTINKVTEKISKVENKVINPIKIKPKEIVEDSSSEEEVVDEEEVVEVVNDEESDGDKLSTASSSSSGGGKNQIGGGSSESEIITLDRYFTKKLESHDSNLFNKGGRTCQANANKQVIALSDFELDRVKKNDILSYMNVKPGEKRTLMKKSVEELTAKYGIDPQVVKSYSYRKHQQKSTDSSVNVNYICPKYWDARSDLSIHPRDIHKYVDDIIPAGLRKGSSKKSVFNRTGTQWENMNDDKFKKEIVKILKLNKIPVDDKIVEYEWDKFQENITSLKLPKEILKKIDNVYVNIANLSEPRWMDSKHNKGDSRFPCCYKQPKNKKRKDKLSTVKQITQTKHTSKLKTVDVITNLSPCNPNRYGHVHPKLQKMFNNTEYIEMVEQNPLGGFIIKGVVQDNNSLIHSLSVLDNTFNNSVKTDYINEILIPYLDNDNAYFTMMRLGDGNIIQLFKKEYNIKDIKDFLAALHYDSTIKRLKKINLHTYVKPICEYFKKVLTGESDDKCTKYPIKEITKEKFKNIINSYPKSHIAILIYNIIISHNNYIKYLTSSEIKDHKYVLPLINEMNKDINVFVFENVNDIIDLKLQLFKYDTKRTKISFIYKNGNKYEPIFYYDNIKKKPHSIINDSFSDIPNVNIYCGLIINGINNKIQNIYVEQMTQLNIETYDEVIHNKDIKKMSFFVDNYSKISHIIDGNNITPIIPHPIKEGLNLVYEFDKKPDLTDIQESKIKGIIVNDDNNIIEVLLNNRTFIPINHVKYDKKYRFKILGNKSINQIDNILQSGTKCNDRSSIFNNEYNYMKYFTRLLVQSIIYHIKNDSIKRDYYTYEDGTFTVDRVDKDEKDDPYNLKIITNVHNGKKVNFVEENNDFFDQDESEKFYGMIRDSKVGDIPDTNKLKIEIKYYEIIKITLNNKILLNYDKQLALSKIINNIIDDNHIFDIKDKAEYSNYSKKLMKDINIYTDKSFSNRCVYDNIKNKLIINENNNKLLNTIREKVVWNLVDLLLINKNIDIVNSILQNNIDRGELYKSEKSDEIFFTYSEFVNNKLDDIFRSVSSFVREINFYDYNNDVKVSLNKPKPISPKLPKIPNIVKLLFGNDTTILTYLDKYNMDFMTIDRGLNSCFPNNPTDYKKIKYLIYNRDSLKIGMEVSFLNKGVTEKGLISTISDNHVLVNLPEKRVKVSLSKLQYEKSFNINTDNLDELVKKELFMQYNIGFLLITNINDLDKLKHNLILIYNSDNVNKDTKFILLYHLYNNKIDSYNLTSIMIKNTINYLTLEQLYENNKIKKIIDTDYPDIKEYKKK